TDARPHRAGAPGRATAGRTGERSPRVVSRSGAKRGERHAGGAERTHEAAVPPEQAHTADADGSEMKRAEREEREPRDQQDERGAGQTDPHTPPRSLAPPPFHR